MGFKAGMIDYMRINLWDVNIHKCPNFNGYSGKLLFKLGQG